MLRLIYWGKIMSMSSERWGKKIYRMSRGNYERNGSENWCSATHKMKELGLEDVWNKDSIVGMVGWNARVKVVIAEREEREWKIRMMKKPMLRKYVKMKDELKLEDYLMSVGSRRDKINMIELRGGMNGLEINKGRREGVARGDRWCRCCGRGVEDEKHFMLKCEVYSTDRKEMMLEMNDVCEIGINMIERAEGSDDAMMDMLIGRGMEENHEEGMSIVQSYVRRSMRRRREVIG